VIVPGATILELTLRTLTRLMRLQTSATPSEQPGRESRGESGDGVGPADPDARPT